MSRVLQRNNFSLHLQVEVEGTVASLSFGGEDFSSRRPGTRQRLDAFAGQEAFCRTFWPCGFFSRKN